MRWLLLVGLSALASCELPEELSRLQRIAQAWKGVEVQAQTVVLQDGVEITATSYRTPRGLASLLRVSNQTTSLIWWDDEVHHQASSSSFYDTSEEGEVEEDLRNASIMMVHTGCDFGPPDEADPSWGIAPGGYRLHIIRLDLSIADNPAYVESWRYTATVAKPARKAPRHAGDWGSLKISVGYPVALYLEPPPTPPSLLRSREH